jgi:hypothetical protein
MLQIPLPEAPSERYKFEVLFSNNFTILDMSGENIKIVIDKKQYHLIKSIAYPIIEQYAYDRILVNNKFIVPRNNNVDEIMAAVQEAGGFVEEITN